MGFAPMMQFSSIFGVDSSVNPKNITMIKGMAVIIFRWMEVYRQKMDGLFSQGIPPSTEKLLQ